MNLYEISSQYSEALEMLSDMDVPAEAIADTLEAIEGSFEVKAINVGAWIRGLEATKNAVKSEADRLTERAKKIDAKIERGKEYLKRNMEAMGKKEIPGPYFDIRVRKNPESVDPGDEELIPDDYFTVKTEKKLNKDDVKRALKGGFKVGNARLFRNTKVVIS